MSMDRYTQVGVCPSVGEAIAHTLAQESVCPLPLGKDAAVTRNRHVPVHLDTPRDFVAAGGR